MTPTKPFEDVSIALEGACRCENLQSLLTHKLRYRARTQIISWERLGTELTYTLTNNNTRVRRGDNAGWNSPFYSQKQLAETISYFQMKIINNTDHSDGDGIIIGVCKKKSLESQYKYLNPHVCNAIYNNADSLGALTGVRVIKPCSARTGDVVGVVADLLVDEIRFYVNTKLVAIGKTKPSALQPLHAVFWTHYANSEIEMGDYFPYESLEVENKER
jgi:hypothetical protein